MPKEAIKFIRKAEEEAAFRIKAAEKEVDKAEKDAIEEAKKRREAEIFKLKKELESTEKSEEEKALREAEKINEDTKKELVKIQELGAANREKAVELVISSLFKGD